MFEDETIDIACPECGHTNTLLVRDLEQHPECHFVCEGCKAGVKIDASEFQSRLEAIRAEVENLERSAEQASKRKARKVKGDFQI